MPFGGDDRAALVLLLPGREMRTTSTRRIYFVDHNMRTTTWDNPRLPMVIAVQARLSAEDRLLPEPASNTPDRRRQM
ncbi:hypothetical protein BJY52DRAFT_1344554 [Lactarius psammicola]|nr:hypothetical protein BJY52DRAFT_1344554 [Lactarius psammicola]